MSTSRTSTEALENWEEAEKCSGLLTWVRVDWCQAKVQRAWDYFSASYWSSPIGSMLPVKWPKSSSSNYKMTSLLHKENVTCSLETKNGPQAEPWFWPKCAQQPFYLLLLPLLSNQLLLPCGSPWSPEHLYLDSTGQSKVASITCFVFNLVMA